MEEYKIESYTHMAKVYDRLMEDVNYELWANNVEKMFLETENNVENILEIACGTGNITKKLAKKGYKIKALDISKEMIFYAKEKLSNKDLNIEFLVQDMKNISELTGKFDSVICCCDGFNYITEKEDLKKIFTKIWRILPKNGRFIFDLSSAFKLKNILGDNIFGESFEDLVYIWRNYYIEMDDTVEMELDFFIKDENGKYDRFEEFHIQKAYDNKEILYLLKEIGFVNIRAYSDFSFKQANKNSERVFFSAQK